MFSFVLGLLREGVKWLIRREHRTVGATSARVRDTAHSAYGKEISRDSLGCQPGSSDLAGLCFSHDIGQELENDRTVVWEEQAL